MSLLFPKLLPFLLLAWAINGHAEIIGPGKDLVFKWNYGAYSGNYQIDLETTEFSQKAFRFSLGAAPRGNSLGSLDVPIFGPSEFQDISFSSTNLGSLPSSGVVYGTFSSAGSTFGVEHASLGLQDDGFRRVKGDLINVPAARPAVQPLDSQGQSASIISAWARLVQGARNTEETYLERIQDCAREGESCDFDAVANDEQFRENLQNAADATYASKDIVTRTSLTPRNKAELVADAPFILREIRALFAWIGAKESGEDEPEVISASVEGEVGEFTVNPDFLSYLISYDILVDGLSDLDGLAGENFMIGRSLGGFSDFGGFGTLESVESLGDGTERIRFSLNHIETNDLDVLVDPVAVPLPSTITLLLPSLGLLIGWRTLARRQQFNMRTDTSEVG